MNKENLFGNHQSTKSNNLFSSQQSANNSNLFGNNKATPVVQDSKPVGFGFGTSDSTTPSGQFQQLSFAENNIATNNSLLGSNANSGVRNIAIGEDVKFTPVTGTDTWIIDGAVERMQTRFQSITFMKEFESMSLEELRHENYTNVQESLQTVGLPQPSIFGSSNGRTLSVTMMSEESGTNSKPGVKFFNSRFTGFGPSMTIKNCSAGRSMAKKEGIIKAKKVAAWSLPSSSSNKFGGFESTSTTNKTSVSGVKPSGTIGSINTKSIASSTSQTGTDAITQITNDDKIPQLTEELNYFKLDFRQLKNSPKKGKSKFVFPRKEEMDKILREQKAINERLANDVQNLMQLHWAAINQNIERKKTLLNSMAQHEGNGSSIDCGNEDIEKINDDEQVTGIKNYAGPRLEDGKVTLKFMKELMKSYMKQERLNRNYAFKILFDVKTLFESQPSLVDVEIPDSSKFTICGDIHGQFFDLLNIFKINGYPSESNPYLFNGDIVDRGFFSTECIFTLFGFKLLYPNHFFIARGNHESALMNEKYGFEEEVKLKYSPSMYSLFNQVFNLLPLAHCLNGKVLVIHGGLFSRDDVTLDEIRKIDRNKQPPETGIMCELLWSDPQSVPGVGPSKRGGKRGIRFGPDVTDKFIKNNNLDYIIRSHEFKQNGYDVCHDGRCITIFSAPNYCGTMKNQGAIIILNGKEMLPKFKTFQAVHVQSQNR